jgi:hypothetical protein
VENLKGRVNVGNLDIDGRMMLKLKLKKTVSENVNWIIVAQSRIMFQGLLNIVMNFWVP